MSPKWGALGARRTGNQLRKAYVNILSKSDVFVPEPSLCVDIVLEGYGVLFVYSVLATPPHLDVQNTMQFECVCAV